GSWDVVGEAANGRAAVDLVARRHPDVAILDYAMPELNGLAATRQIRAAHPDTQALMRTMHDSEPMIRDLLAAGATGYVLKSDAGNTLLDALASLRSGRPFFTGKVTELVLKGYLQTLASGQTAAPESEALTAREREVVQLIAEGRSTKGVAAA